MSKKSYRKKAAHANENWHADTFQSRNYFAHRSKLDEFTDQLCSGNGFGSSVRILPGTKLIMISLL
ncbi:MAG: hypothetical protein BGO52_16815 [Sphingobacteriales bacterium 44-61]|nr:MAG: hypothetical protein BGO52_16815 [Sphingobacteriales bacterium 44-61]